MNQQIKHYLKTDSTTPSQHYLIVELAILFLFIPYFLLINITPVYKVSLLLLGVSYTIFLSIKSKEINGKILFQRSLIPYWKPVIFRFIILLVFTISLMTFSDAENLFIVIKKDPFLWLIISFIYSIFSVYPQEFVYRSFFFMRYQSLFKSKLWLIIINACVFSFAHVMFQNMLVFALTFIGGILFAITYSKTKSLLFTSLEHALYGAWLFTVGMGEMLKFPTP